MKLTDNGKVAKVSTVHAVREITREDLPRLVEKRNSTPLLARIRDPHHRVARMFAMGMRVHEVRDRTGYSYQRLATLRGDPSFKELVAQYRNDVHESFKENVDDYHELLVSNMLKAETQLAEKLEIAEEEGEFLPVRDLIAISRDAADRTGYGKRQTNLNVNVDFAAQLEKAIARSCKVIEGSVGPATMPQGKPPVLDSHSHPQPIRRLA